VEARQERRLAKNETLFREVNERVAEIADGFAGEPDGVLLDFVCECGRAECTQRLQLSRSEYEAVRSEPTRFLVAPGHTVREIEDVVDRNERFTVVEKHPGQPAEIADEADPRG
jgi:hypothetical protein